MPSSSPRPRSLALLLAASTLARALQTPAALFAHVQAACTASGPPVCIIDGNNLRGAEFFGSSQGSLRALVEGWADEAQLPALLILDHGPEERAWHVSGHAALTLSGEGRTADDVIVRDAWYVRHELGRNVFVVTNDQGLIGRVKRYRSPAGSVQVLHTRAFARLLGIEESTATDARASKVGLVVLAPTVELATYGSRRLHACVVRLRGPGPRGPAVQPWRGVEALRGAAEASISLRLATQVNSRPRETTADRSAAAIELAAQLEAGVDGPAANGAAATSGSDALLAQYVTWARGACLTLPSWWCRSSVPWPPGVDSPCSWLRHALGMSRSAVQPPSGRRRCGGAARPKSPTPGPSAPR